MPHAPGCAGRVKPRWADLERTCASGSAAGIPDGTRAPTRKCRCASSIAKKRDGYLLQPPIVSSRASRSGDKYSRR